MVYIMKLIWLFTRNMINIRKIKSLKRAQESSDDIDEEDSQRYQFIQHEKKYTSMDDHLPVPVYI